VPHQQKVPLRPRRHISRAEIGIPDPTQLEDIKKIDRFREIPKTGLFCDLMWADPVDSKNGYCENIIKHNDVRGCSYFFGSELAKNFFEKNKVISIIRAH
jgi:serine/threonine-protein phosphatase 2B catalytic subunit